MQHTIIHRGFNGTPRQDFTSANVNRVFKFLHRRISTGIWEDAI